METNPSSSSSSSSSSSPPAKRFDVFLSFRGEDTRRNFINHLSLALKKIGIFTIFEDAYALERGKEIGSELMKAIENSQYAVVVLSENYATSSWCLKELTKIVECMGDSGRIKTIFYHVNPSHVRNLISSDVKKQKESSFWKALKEHAKNRRHSQYLESWRNALVKVANQSGYPLDGHTDEATFIEYFVANISRELDASIRTIDGLIGMTSRLRKLDSYILQSAGTNNVCFIGIHGMVGTGKSTLAEAYYNQMSYKFDGSCFLRNVREVCRNANGLMDLQKKLLSDILKCEFAEIRYVEDGINMIKSRLRRKKVLIILDDVSEEKQLIAIADEENWFGSGSIIIVTAREISFLISRRYAIYRAESLNLTEALQLFSLKAFQSLEPPEDYKELSKQVVKYAGCLPLALLVLGSLLHGKNTSEWVSALHRLRNSGNEIVKTLKLSFDDLNNTDQRIFLDIACFFSGFDKDYVKQILDSCYSDSEYGISNLIDNSLLSIKHGRKLWMHDLLREMGKNIVREESKNELERQSRIWDTDDLYKILKNKKGTNEVEAIVICGESSKAYSFEGLSSMKKLRLLKIAVDSQKKCDDCDGPELSNNLRYLDWQGFPYNKFPSAFQPRKLVQLVLWNSNIKKLWNNDMKPLLNLKVMDLSFSLSFNKFEDFTVVPNLETLILQHCEKLSEIHSSIGKLKRLILLNLDGCTSLEKLPEEINGLASLQTLSLVGCFKLEKLPNKLERLKSLRNLDIEDSRIEHLPSSIFLMENLESLSRDDEEMIESAVRENIISYRTTGKSFFPGSFCTYLTRLVLSDCNLSGPEAFPEYFGKLVSLRYLDLSQNPFSVLPPSISGLSRLKSLSLKNCKSLERLEAELLPSSMEEVDVSYCTSLASFLDPLKPCHLQCSSVHCLDCNELVERQDGRMTALASLSRFLEDPSERRDQDFRFVVPQSDNELPSWFVNKSSTASISIKLDPNWCNSELIGLAMVFCFRSNSSTQDNFSCNIRVRSSENWETTMELGVIERRMSDHLFLLYSPCEDTLEFIKELQPQSCGTLEFSFLGANGEHCLSCGPCGVRLIVEKDIEELKKLTSQLLSQFRCIDPLGSPLLTGLRGILDSEDNLEFLEMQRYANEDPSNPDESTPSMVGSTHFGIFRNYTGITTKFLDNLKGGRESE